jgi:hypothetical protein
VPVLTLACERGDPATVAVLLQAGGDVWAVDEHVRIPRPLPLDGPATFRVEDSAWVRASGVGYTPRSTASHPASKCPRLVRRHTPYSDEQVANRTFSTGDRNWPLDGGQIPNPNVVRVAPGMGYHRVERNRRASRNGPVSDLPPEIPHVSDSRPFASLYTFRLLLKCAAAVRRVGRPCTRVRGRWRSRGGTAMKKLRIAILGFGTARQKRVLERWTNPKPLQPIWDRAAI